MKKIFTLIAVALLGGAVSVNAQGTYAVAEGETFTAGQNITSVTDATLTLNSSGGTYNAGKKVQNWVEADFVAYTTGSENGKLVSNDAPTGCVYIIKTVKAGQVTVGVQLSPNKGFHILDKDFAEVTGYSYNLPASADATESQVMTTNAKGEAIIPADGAKSNGTVTFNVAANGTYYVFAAGTKMGFFGFKYTVTNGINNIATDAFNANAPIYNLAGQQVSKDFKGVCIQNGKKFINK